MRKKIEFYHLIVLLFMFGSVNSVIGQTDQKEIDNLFTDRPTQTASPKTLPKGYFQWESGFQYTKGPFATPQPNGQILFREDIKNFTYNTSLFRYGLTDKIELRLIQDFGQLRSGEFVFGPTIRPTLIGTKIHIAEASGLKPQIGFLAHVGGPVFSKEQSGTQADFRFNFEHALSEKLTLAYNLGGQLVNDLNDFVGLYTLVFGYNFTPELFAFAEFYGFLKKGVRADNQMDFGIAYLVSPNFQLDLYTGTGLNRDNLASPTSILGFGFSLRIPKN